MSDAVRLVLEEGRACATTARAAGISEGKLRRAVQKERARRAADPTHIPPLPKLDPPEKHAPKGWEPGVRWEKGTDLGTITVASRDEAPGEGAAADYLRRLGFDPDLYQFEPVEVTAKETNVEAWWHRDNDGEDAVTRPVTNTVFFARFKLTRRSAGLDFDIDELIDRIPTPKLERRTRSKQPGETLVVMLADWQFGKRDQGGVEALVGRLKALGPAVVRRVAELRAMGRNVECIAFVGLGDLVEGCVGFYPQQLHAVELDRRTQLRGVRRMLTELIVQVAPLNIPMVVTGVAGNHGENRGAGGNKGGMTTPGDNDDLIVLETVAEAFEHRPGYGHVSFVVPDQELSHTLDFSGMHTLMFHGHMSSGGWKGIWTWFKNQIAHGHTSARLLLCGHYHHLHLEQDGDLTVLQATALEGGSDYYTARFGAITKPGTTTALVSAAGVRDIAVL